MPAVLTARPGVARAECELLSLKLDSAALPADKLEHFDGEYNDKHRGLSSLAASYVPPVGTTLFERSSSHPTRRPSSFSSLSTLSCLSVVSSLLERSSSFWPSLPRSRGSLSFSASAPPPPPPSVNDFSSDDSDSELDSDSDSGSSEGEQWDALELERAEDDNLARLNAKAVNEVELLEYSKPATPRDASPPLSVRLHSAEPPTSRAESEDSSATRSDTLSSANTTSSNNIRFNITEPVDEPLFSFEWLRRWQVELNCHIRQREADRRKKRRTLRTVLLIDDDECCHAQLSDSEQPQLALTTRYRHMTLTLRIAQPAAGQRSDSLAISADIHLPQLAATFASFVALHRQPPPRASRLSFALTPSASFSSPRDTANRLSLQPLDRRSHPLARSSSLVGFVQSRLAPSLGPPAAPPLLPFLRSHVWPLMLDFMQPATHEQSVPQHSAEGNSLHEEARTRQQMEASEARLAERQSRWAAEIQRMEERDRRHSGKENRAADAQRRRGRQRERETTDERQVRPRKRTMED